MVVVEFFFFFFIFLTLGFREINNNINKIYNNRRVNERMHIILHIVH